MVGQGVSGLVDHDRPHGGRCLRAKAEGLLADARRAIEANRETLAKELRDRAADCLAMASVLP